jgi:hypothetical protein
LGARVRTGDGSPGLELWAEARAGWLFDFSSSSVLSDRSGFGWGTVTGSATATTSSAMAAGSANIGFRFSETFAIHVGYEALWLSHVGLATDQVGATGDLLSSPAPYVVPMGTAYGSFLMHGARAGFDLQF